MVNSIQNPPDTPRIDSYLPLLIHAKDDPTASSTSVRSSNSTITETKNAEFLDDTNHDRSQCISNNNAKHQAVAEKSEESEEFLRLLKEIVIKQNEMLLMNI